MTIDYQAEYAKLLKATTDYLEEPSSDGSHKRHRLRAQLKEIVQDSTQARIPLYTLEESIDLSNIKGLKNENS